MSVSPTVRVLLFIPAFFFVMAILQFATLLATLLALGDPARLIRDLTTFSSPVALALNAAGLVATLTVVYAFRHLLDRASLASLGLGLSRPWVSQLAFGFALGAVLMSGIFIVEVLTGWYHLVAAPTAQPGLLAGLGLALLTFLLVGIAEELVARGYVLQNLELDWRLGVALVASSLLFGVAHLANPGASVISTLGVSTAGLLLGTAYVATRALWMPIGLHWAWNFFEGPVYGFPVSGLTGQSLLEVRPSGPDWLTGGAFGPEASVVAVTVELAAAVGLLFWAARRGKLTGS